MAFSGRALVGIGGLWLLSAPAALQAGLLMVGVSGTAPFVIRDGESYEGISVEVWNEVARDGQLDYQWDPRSSSEANLRALSAGEIDIAIGPIGITPERVAMEGIEFSQPYYYSQIGLLLPARAASLWSRLRPTVHLAALWSLAIFLLALFLVGNLIWLVEKEKNSNQFPTHYLHGVGNGMWFALVTLTTVGYGTGALLGRGIRRVREVHWLAELGNAQAMWVFEVENFGPFIVDSDLQGNSLFEQQAQLVNANLERVYQGLRPPALSRYGETDDRKDELI